MPGFKLIDISLNVVKTGNFLLKDDDSTSGINRFFFFSKRV